MVNIASIRTERDRTGLHVYIGLEVPNARLLVRILHRIQALVNVRMVSCLPEDDDEVPGMLTTPFIIQSNFILDLAVMPQTD